MTTVVNIKDVKPLKQEGRDIYWLLGPKTSCTSGCSMALGCYNADEFVLTGAHTDQEGFYVLEGRGYAQIGEEVIRLQPGDAFLVRPGLVHAIKKDRDCACVKALFFHAAV
jgi:gentisate 1,2-dioxygenase